MVGKKGGERKKGKKEEEKTSFCPSFSTQEKQSEANFDRFSCGGIADQFKAPKKEKGGEEKVADCIIIIVPFFSYRSPDFSLQWCLLFPLPVSPPPPVNFEAQCTKKIHLLKKKKM